MNPWQRLVGTREEPRRVGNPGVVFGHGVLAAGWLYIGLSALTDGRTIQGALGLGLALASSALAYNVWRKRRNERG